MTTQLAREQLIQKILGDTACCDILISLFASALESHRWNFLLRPFPSSFLLQNPINHDDKKDINSLVTSFEAIPPITLLREKPDNIMTANLEHSLRIARLIAREAGEMMKAAFKLPKNVEFKGRTDLVTETDKKIEEYISTQLKTAFPHHKFLGEETVAAMKNAGNEGVEVLTADPTWIVDPVDGTTNFVHSIPYSCVSIGLAVDCQPVVGVVYNPITEEMFTAIKGAGAYLNDLPIYVGKHDELIRSIVATGIPHDKSFHREIVQGNLQFLMNNCQAIRINGSAALDLCSVACGRIDIYYEYAIHSWDIAAGALIVQEAGGQVCDPFYTIGDNRNRQPDFTNGRCIAGNKVLLEKFLQGIRKTD